MFPCERVGPLGPEWGSCPQGVIHQTQRRARRIRWSFAATRWRDHIPQVSAN